MRPTIRPTAAEMEETDRFDYTTTERPRPRFYDWNNPKAIRDARTGRWLSMIEMNPDRKYFEEKRLIGLQMEESYWGDPKFILEK